MGRIPVESITSRTVTVDGRELLAFAGCNYLGLANHPRVLGAVERALRTHGISTTASRETTGNTLVHEALERELAEFLGQEAAILSAEGYTANFAVAQALSSSYAGGEHAVALIDAKSHRSIRNASLAAGLRVLDYAHRDTADLAELSHRHGSAGVAVFTDGVFAADGAVAPISRLLEAMPRTRSTLVIDDCHGFCVLGKGAGSIAEQGVRDPRLCMTTTLAKGLGCYGGCVAGPRELIQAVRDRASVYRGHTPVPPAIAAGAREALRVVREEPEWLERLWSNTHALRAGLESLGLIPRLGPGERAMPIFTFVVSPASRMDEVHRRVLEAGVLAPLIEYPGGPAPRFFRVTVSAAHEAADVTRLLETLERCL